LLSSRSSDKAHPAASNACLCSEAGPSAHRAPHPLTPLAPQPTAPARLTICKWQMERTTLPPRLAMRHRADVSLVCPQKPQQDLLETGSVHQPSPPTLARARTSPRDQQHLEPKPCAEAEVRGKPSTAPSKENRKTTAPPRRPCPFRPVARAGVWGVGSGLREAARQARRARAPTLRARVCCRRQVSATVRCWIGLAGIGLALGSGEGSARAGCCSSRQPGLPGRRRVQRKPRRQQAAVVAGAPQARARGGE